MMKNLLSTTTMLVSLLILSGCTGYDPILSNKDAETSKAYTHTTKVVNVPYGKAVSNFKRGLHMCAENVNTPSLVEVGTGAVRMPGDSFYHVVKQRSGKLEYNLRWNMGGVAVGDCTFCQPEGGYYSIYTTLQRASGNKTKIRTHTYSKFSDEVEAIERWTQGDLSGCHGFMGKD
jgi:hypothetical protein